MELVILTVRSAALPMVPGSLLRQAAQRFLSRYPNAFADQDSLHSRPNGNRSGNAVTPHHKACAAFAPTRDPVARLCLRQIDHWQGPCDCPATRIFGVYRLRRNG